MSYIEANFIVLTVWTGGNNNFTLWKIMYLLGLGILLVLLKYLEVDPVAMWTWWWVLSPFALTVVWWAWADASGYTKRKAMEKMDLRKKKRIERQKEALGTGTRRRR